ncbi:hypothetical protein CEXT_416091 [Caerostris extrusa]|uniref:Uncharacterized protein n=1 Tax=Caerostris extrusa TaxID=172846 RepID=A0AAV4N1U6_CAEEX|nr:hypothetical protein CEXT_416091 [Caerostris extrusa]
MTAAQDGGPYRTENEGHHDSSSSHDRIGTSARGNLKTQLALNPHFDTQCIRVTKMTTDGDHRYSLFE